jgi:hypothetical protein
VNTTSGKIFLSESIPRLTLARHRGVGIGLGIPGDLVGAVAAGLAEAWGVGTRGHLGLAVELTGPS